MNEKDVSEYLSTHPEFFEAHSELLASLSLPHPHGNRAVSLAERQMLALREKNKALELKIADVVRMAKDSDALVERLMRWTRLLLLQRNVRMLADTLLGSLSEIFAVPLSALRIWDAADDYADLPCVQGANLELADLAARLSGPVLGAPLAAHRVAIELLGETNVQSVALIPLRRGGEPGAFGIIVLGSGDPRRFHGGMGTEFLARIGETASAALSRIAA